MEQLSQEKLAVTSLQSQLDRLTAEHAKTVPLIASLRAQIKETKDALDLDDEQLENTRTRVVDQSKVLEEQLETGGPAALTDEGDRAGYRALVLGAAVNRLRSLRVVGLSSEDGGA